MLFPPYLLRWAKIPDWVSAANSTRWGKCAISRPNQSGDLMGKGDGRSAYRASSNADRDPHPMPGPECPCHGPSAPCSRLGVEFHHPRPSQHQIPVREGLCEALEQIVSFASGGGESQPTIVSWLKLYLTVANIVRFLHSRMFL